MAKNTTTTTKVPAEDLRAFIRDVGVRSFDRLALRYGESEFPEFERSRRGAAIARLARLWQEMTAEEKAKFFDHVITAAEAAALATPAVIGIRKLRKKREEAAAKGATAEQRSTRPGKKK